ncbi:MAG: molecular chaperone DnaJ [Deltaproteobacteria bacterium]|nr:molecular chaperone DnaJ [Deltaproteobacteria bacterium]MBU54437.1 molecular chaperone DnaJ [Deltaproteobacteria bacterium]|tara:strand:+ start:2464 stop:3384 length:921 start_codon:yes stop_codon:yes gene_type:complete
MSQQKDLYRILGVSKSASHDEIKAAYKTLVRKYHPDLNPNDTAAEDKFKEVAVAFEVLGDEKKRKLYDEFGMDGLRAGFDPEQARAYQQWGGGNPFGGNPFGGGGFDINSIFEQMFSGRSYPRPPGPSKGADIETSIEIDFLDAVLGSKKSVTLPNSTQLNVSIPPGVTEDNRIRISGQGTAGKRGGPPGDLFLKVKIRSHPLYKRDGNNLLMELPLTAKEAYEGTQVDVPTPTGSVKMRIPPRSQTGQKMRLKGKGVKGKGTRPDGNLLLTLKVMLPSNEHERAKEILEELEQFYEKDVREHFHA